MKTLKTVLIVFIALTFLIKLHCVTKIVKVINNSKDPVQIKTSERHEKGPPPSAKEIKTYIQEIVVLEKIKPKTTIVTKKDISVPTFPDGSIIIKTMVGKPQTGRHFLFIMKNKDGTFIMLKRLRGKKEEIWGKATSNSEIQELFLTVNEDYSVTIKETE